MNSKGQMNGMGMLIMVFVAVLVGVILFQSIAQNNGTMLDTAAVVNNSQTLPAAGSSIYLTDYKVLTGVTMVNATSGATVPATNYTITNNVVYNGAEAVQVTSNGGDYASQPVYISGTGQPLTYVGDSGSRAVIGLILIFFGLAIVVAALMPIYKDDFMRSIIGR